MNLPLSFRAAADTVMPFGLRKGKTIDQIAETDDGLLFLDWMRGELDGDPPHPESLRGGLHESLRVYLDDSTIAADLARIT
jgi:hypothetical protein